MDKITEARLKRAISTAAIDVIPGITIMEL
jgi:hypothetical protein